MTGCRIVMMKLKNLARNQKKLCVFIGISCLTTTYILAQHLFSINIMGKSPWNMHTDVGIQEVKRYIDGEAVFQEHPTVQKYFSWPTPEHASALRTQDSTFAKYTSYEVLYQNGKSHGQFKQGDKLQVNIVARDYRGEQKRYGGDYFRVLLKTDKDTTSVIADITDNLDGTYTAILPLHFSGKARLKVIMIHPSEAIDLLRRVTSTKWSPGLFFSARFKEENYEENTECNIWLPSMHDEPLSEYKNRYCNFSNTKTGEPWYCEKPKKLGCDAFISYGMGRNFDGAHFLVKSGLFERNLNLRVQIGKPTEIVIVPGGDVFNRPLCTASKAGNLPPRPAGYFLRDVWHSTHCAARFFLDGPSHVNCLQNKFIYLFGDSTIRQWYSYYVPLVSSKIFAGFDYYFGIKGITLYEKQKTPTVWEPRTAVNEYKNLSIHFAAHGMPLQNGGGRESVPYIADSIDAVQGGPDTVVAFTIGFHLLLYDPSVYVRRLITIREAIGRLLKRSPETIVIFKGLNFYKMDDMFNNQCCLSEWLALRLETIARAIFKEEKRMVVLDTWDMTASHYSIPDGLHPTNQIIENEIQLFLSFVCPNK